MTFYTRLRNMAQAYFPSDDSERDDLLQVTLIAAWQSGLLPDPTIEYVEGEIGGKLAHLMKCRFIDRVRHQSVSPLEPIESAWSQTCEIETHTIDLKRAIESLPPALGRLVHQIGIEGWTLKEIAHQRGVSHVTVWRELHAARLLLQSSLEGQSTPLGATEGS